MSKRIKWLEVFAAKLRPGVQIQAPTWSSRALHTLVNPALKGAETGEGLLVTSSAENMSSRLTEKTVP